MRLQHPVHDRDVRPWNFVHRDVARLVPLIRRVRQEQEVPAVERGLHRATSSRVSRQAFSCFLPRAPPPLYLNGNAPEHDDDRGLGVRDEPEALPDHEPGGEHGHEVEDLQEHLETIQDATRPHNRFSNLLRDLDSL